MVFVNKVEISGRAVRDAVRTGKGPFRFSIACGGGKKRDSEERWPVEYFDVVTWHQSADKVHHGDEVLVIGRLKHNTWERDGVKHSRVEIVATELPYQQESAPIDTKPAPPITPKYELPERPAREIKSAPSRPVTPSDPISDEDIPF